MEYKKNYFKYYAMVIHVAQGMMEPMMEADNEESKNVIMNSILGLDVPTSLNHRISPHEFFIANKIFRPMSEIMYAIEAIENIAVYARSFPYKRQGISRIAYLKYHVENYLNELYLLKNRLIKYLKLIEKSYKKSNISEHVSHTIAPLYKVVSKTLKGYIEVRGSHVHENRYSDNDFDRLSTLELLSKGSDKNKFSETMTQLSNVAYSDIRKKWVDKINADFEGIQNLLDLYFEHLLIAISKNGDLIFPNDIKKV